MKLCIECNSPTRNKRSSLCQSCFDKAFEKNIDKDIAVKAMQIRAENPINSWF